MKEKTVQLKKVIELTKQNTYEKKNKKNTIPEALISTKEKQIRKGKPKQRSVHPKNKMRNAETNHVRIEHSRANTA